MKNIFKSWSLARNFRNFHIQKHHYLMVDFYSLYYTTVQLKIDYCSAVIPTNDFYSSKLLLMSFLQHQLVDFSDRERPFEKHSKVELLGRFLEIWFFLLFNLNFLRLN